MKFPVQALLPIAFAASLAGCDGEAEPEPAGDERADAAGEVLEGSISDDMLPYDTLRSQPPLAQIRDIPESEGGPSAVAPPAGEASPVPDAGLAQDNAQDGSEGGAATGDDAN